MPFSDWILAGVITFLTKFYPGSCLFPTEFYPGSWIFGTVGKWIRLTPCTGKFSYSLKRFSLIRSLVDVGVLLIRGSRSIVAEYIVSVCLRRSRSDFEILRLWFVYMLPYKQIHYCLHFCPINKGLIYRNVLPTDDQSPRKWNDMCRYWRVIFKYGYPVGVISGKRLKNFTNKFSRK